MPKVSIDQRAVLLFQRSDGFEAVGLDGRLLNDRTRPGIEAQVRHEYPGVRIHECRYTGNWRRWEDAA